MSRSFEAGGKTWVLDLDAPTIRTIREEVGVDLVDDGKGYGLVLADVCILVDVLWWICKEQAEAKQIEQNVFKKSIVGPVIAKAEEAVLEAIVGFSPRKESLLRGIVVGNAKVQGKAQEKALARIQDQGLEDRLLQAFEERMDAEEREMLTQLKQPTNTPASAV